MGRNGADMMYRVNCLASDLDALYHQAALKLGLSDSVMFVLYLVYERDGKCPLNTICKETSISKQNKNGMFHGKRQGVCGKNRRAALSRGAQRL